MIWMWSVLLLGSVLGQQMQDGFRGKPEPCRAPPDVRQCHPHAQMRWFYNPQTEECTTFLFRGCPDNGNTFLTRSDCIQRCAMPNGNHVDTDQVGSDVADQIEDESEPHLDRPNVVQDQPQEGAQVEKVKELEDHISSAPNPTSAPAASRMGITKQDESPLNQPMAPQGTLTGASVPSSSGLKDKRKEFTTFQGAAFDPLWLAVQKSEELNKEEALDVVCNLKVDSGPCRASIPRWFFDRKARECKAFTYGGCMGNDNNFPTEKDCMTICLPGSEQNGAFQAGTETAASVLPASRPKPQGWPTDLHMIQPQLRPFSMLGHMFIPSNQEMEEVEEEETESPSPVVLLPTEEHTTSVDTENTDPPTAVPSFEAGLEGIQELDPELTITPEPEEKALAEENVDTQNNVNHENNQVEEETEVLNKENIEDEKSAPPQVKQGPPHILMPLLNMLMRKPPPLLPRLTLPHMGLQNTRDEVDEIFDPEPELMQEVAFGEPRRPVPPPTRGHVTLFQMVLAKRRPPQQIPFRPPMAPRPPMWDRPQPQNRRLIPLDNRPYNPSPSQMRPPNGFQRTQPFGYPQPDVHMKPHMLNHRPAYKQQMSKPPCMNCGPQGVQRVVTITRTQQLPNNHMHRVQTITRTHRGPSESSSFDIGPMGPRGVSKPGGPFGPFGAFSSRPFHPPMFLPSSSSPFDDSSEDSKFAPLRLIYRPQIRVSDSSESTRETRESSEDRRHPFSSIRSRERRPQRGPARRRGNGRDKYRYSPRPMRPEQERRVLIGQRRPQDAGRWRFNRRPPLAPSRPHWSFHHHEHYHGTQERPQASTEEGPHTPYRQRSYWQQAHREQPPERQFPPRRRPSVSRQELGGPQAAPRAGSPPLACLQPLATGYCPNSLPSFKFYFNKIRGQCEMFYYGGCGGNLNRFDSQADCKAACFGVTGTLLKEDIPILKEEAHHQQQEPEATTLPQAEDLTPSSGSDEIDRMDTAQTVAPSSESTVQPLAGELEKHLEEEVKAEGEVIIEKMPGGEEEPVHAFSFDEMEYTTIVAILCLGGIALLILIVLIVLYASKKMKKSQTKKEKVIEAVLRAHLFGELPKITYVAPPPTPDMPPTTTV